ncbi:MAG: exonuclease domain-containing protein [Candidatus Moraniibacteriota bacterium]|jgi:exodeoxyribonuclease X
MNKEKSKNLLFLDVEATGLTEEDRLVQVAYDFEGTEKEAMFSPGRDMEVEAMEVTHITNKHLEGKEEFQGSKFYDGLKEILDKDETIFIAHNAPYDVGMVERENLKVGKTIDTYKVAQALDVKSEIPAYRLQYLRYYLGIELDNVVAHDALGDVRVLAAVFERMYDKMMRDSTHAEVIEKMMKITSEPLLIKRLTFGKHRGELIADVARTNRGWLEWLLTQKESDAANGDIDEDWIYTLKHYLR